METFNLQFPTWFVLLCIVLGAVFALLLYFRDTTFADHPRWTRLLMSTLRFLSVTCISFLLLSPFLRLLRETVQNPVIVIGQDDSASLNDAMSSEDSTHYVAAVQRMRDALSEKYDVRMFTFGEATRQSDSVTFRQQVTDIADFLDHTYEALADQNTGAIILATDGLYNRGRNPLYLSQRLSAPLYSIALGDTTIKTDLLVSRVLHNTIAFLGDKFPVQVDVSASRLAGRTATLRIERIDGSERTLLEERTLRIDGENWFRTEEFLLEARHPGVTRYRAQLSSMPGEVLYSNNSKDFYIEVIDGRVRILVLGNSPHPDLAAFSAVLQEQQNSSADIVLFKDFKGNVKDYDMVILHQLPSAQHDIQPLLSQMDALQKPRLFVVGSQTLLNRFNAAQPYLRIASGQQAVNEVTAIIEPSFNLFKVANDMTAQISRFAPLAAPFGQYEVAPNAQVYLWQRIGRVETQFPLILFGETSGVKTCILAAEGFWRWRLHDYMQTGSHELTHGFMSKVFQYSTVKEDKRRFRAAPIKNLYMDRESIVFDAELYNRTYEQVNDPDVFLEVRDEEGNEFRYTFSRQLSAYTLSLGRFPVGEYRYTAYADYDGQRHQAGGRFSVQATELESYVTTADHRLLQSLASAYGGAVYYPGEMDALTQHILSHDRIKPVLYSSSINQPLIHMRWLFFAFLVLLGLEWFVRRYLGGY